MHNAVFAHSVADVDVGCGGNGGRCGIKGKSTELRIEANRVPLQAVLSSKVRIPSFSKDSVSVLYTLRFVLLRSSQAAFRPLRA